MTCIMCGRQEKSDPAKETQWRGIEADGEVFYVCPAEFPPDGASSGAYARAYEKVLRKVIKKRGMS